MMTPRSLVLLFSICSFLIGPLLGEPLEGWGTDIKEAFKTAKEEDKRVLVEFTGSDWCPPCIAMRKNVFSKKEFVEAASKDFVLLELDFPKKSQAPKKHTRFAREHKVSGYPTIVIFDAGRKEITRFIASRHPTTEQFLAQLEKVIREDEKADG